MVESGRRFWPWMLLVAGMILVAAAVATWATR